MINVLLDVSKLSIKYFAYFFILNIIVALFAYCLIGIRSKLVNLKENYEKTSLISENIVKKEN